MLFSTTYHKVLCMQSWFEVSGTVLPQTPAILLQYLLAVRPDTSNYLHIKLHTLNVHLAKCVENPQSSPIKEGLSMPHLINFFA